MELLPILENIVGEIDAIKLYTKAIEQCTDPDVIKVLTSIRDEEKVHIGELMYIALKVSPELTSKVLEGCEEVKELLEDKV